MYNPKTGKGMGDFFDKNRKAMTRREWKGFRDTFYEFGRWLKLYGYMAFKTSYFDDEGDVEISLAGFLSDCGKYD